MNRPKDIVGLDFETYFDQKYSLRSPKMSTSEYVRDERFKMQCVGIRTNRQRKARWYTGYNAIKALKSFDWKNTALLCHNTAFDGLILSHHYDIVPAYYYDTLSMARALHSNHIGAGLDEVAKYYGYAGKVKADALKATKGIRDLPEELMTPLGEYCADDVTDMWNIFKHMGENYPQDELDLIHYTINAFCNPVLDVDVPRASKELVRATKESRKLILRTTKLVGTAGLAPRDKYDATIKALRSREIFASSLRQQGIEPPTKISKDTGEETYAFAKSDLDFQALFKHPDKNIRTLCEAKSEASSSISITRATRLIQRVDDGNKLPIMLNYCRAHTFRWSGGDKLNPQNFPARGKNGNELRRSIIAPRGQKIIVVDSGQIEARVIAWLAGQDDLLDVFRASDKGKGPDPYVLLASDIYNRTITKKDKEERFVGKVGVLGLGFQMGAPRYQETLEAGVMGPPVIIDMALARKTVSTYRAKNKHIANYWDFLQRMIQFMHHGKGEREAGVLNFHADGVDVPNGLTLLYPDIRRKPSERWPGSHEYSYQNGRQRGKLYGGLFSENITQCVARIIVGEQMLKIADRYRVVMMSHDEVVYLAPDKQAERAYNFGIKCLTTPPTWGTDIPLSAEGGWDDCYSK